MMPESADELKLTDFMDLAALQEMQDGFAAVANVKAQITDADGNVITSAEPTSRFIARRDALAKQEEQLPEPQRIGREYVAPIKIGDRALGMLRMRTGGDSILIDEDRAARLGTKFGLDPKVVRDLVAQATKDKHRRPAVVQFMFLMANAIARLCYQEYRLRQKISELQVVSNLTLMLADARDLQNVLQRAVKVIADLMTVKACSIRLVDTDRDELVIKAVHNLSDQYINKGMISFSRSQEYFAAIESRGYDYVRDMANDPKVQYPDEAKLEGLVSMLSVGMKHQSNDVGVLRVYSEVERQFTPAEITLLKAIAATAAAAIETARLADENRAAEQLEQQINMAADVQQRMIPQTPPQIPGLDLASIYVPCYQLGGDLYDFIPLPQDNLGIVIADVSGKGVPASLIMASVRAALRAQVDNVYYLGDIMKRINQLLYRDTKPTEFVTLFYGVIDMRSRRMTYSNAGHLPALLLRGGKVLELGAGDQGSLVLGVDPNESFTQTFVDLKPDDTLLLYTDGLNEARNFQDQMFGRQRVVDSLARGGTSADMVAKNVLWDLRRFVGLARATDDVTIVAARVG
jgi:phosphoserine phosphatase RsbU/P